MRSYQRPLARSLFALLLLLGEAVVAFWTAAAAVLFSAWFVSDSLAATFTPWDWWRTGLIRFAVFTLLGTVGGACIFFLNHYVVRHLHPHQNTLPRISAIAFGGLVILASFVGTTFFIVVRPWF